MMTIRTIISITAMITITCQNSFGQKSALTVSQNAFNEEVDSLIISTMDEYGIPGLAVGIVQNGIIIYAKGFGVRSIDSNKQVSENSVFHTASISKLFTAMSVMKLVNTQRIELDERLIDIIPELNYSDERIEKITIKQLLNHTSGLPDINNYHWGNFNQADNSLSDYILGLKLSVATDPSTDFNYSNLGYDILGYVIERVSGILFEDYVEENILATSGMLNSDFRYFNIPDSLKTTPHTRKPITNKVYVREAYPYTREHAPSSTLNASSKDLCQWMMNFLSVINDNKTPSIYSSMLEPSLMNTRIGLGFQLYDVQSHKAVGHFGGDKGFRSFLMMIPEENIGLVVLGNCDYNEDFRQEIIMPIAKLMLTSR
jgi:CubicO group peptidase (beta-lactamase class C family)